ncbi:MAG: hypothetical protein HQ488_00235 [Parcubacteria group bacterium]|nr:hypothetical protein [Parcubacteria group bacterium]
MALRLPEITQRGRLHPSARKERKHTVKTREDAFTRLTVAAAQARHSDIPKERANAALTTLMGGLPPLPAGVEAMIATQYVEVPVAVISQGGSIAFLGIKRSGSKYVVRIDGGTFEMRVVDRYKEWEHIGHVHFPEGSEDVAYTTVLGGGRAFVIWGDWLAPILRGIGGECVGIYCFDRAPHRKCLVTYQHGTFQKMVLYTEGVCIGDNSELDPVHFNCADTKLTVMGMFDNKIAVAMKSASKTHRISQFHMEGTLACPSLAYDAIVKDSLMIRDGELSFVGWNDQSSEEEVGVTGEAFLVRSDSQVSLGPVYQVGQIHCLDSGRVLVETYMRRIKPGGKTVPSVGHLMLSDPLTGHTLTLRRTINVRRILETDSHLVMFVTDDGSEDGHIKRLYFIKKSVDGGWEDRESYTVISGACALLDSGNKKTFTIERGHGGQRQLVALDWERAAPMNEVMSGSLNVHRYCSSAPLYTPSDCLVQTDRGLMSWKFVNGTFYVIRYPW